MRPEPRQSLSQSRLVDARDLRLGRRAQRCGGGPARLFAGAPALQGALFQGDPPDAIPAEVGVDTFDHRTREVLHFKRETTLDPDDERRRLMRFVVAARSPRRPAQLDGFRHGGKPFADDVVPVENEIGFAEALARENGANRRADEVGERARPRALAGPIRCLHGPLIAKLHAGRKAPLGHLFCQSPAVAPFLGPKKRCHTGRFYPRKR